MCKSKCFDHKHLLHLKFETIRLARRVRQLKNPHHTKFTGKQQVCQKPTEISTRVKFNLWTNEKLDLFKQTLKYKSTVGWWSCHHHISTPSFSSRFPPAVQTPWICDSKLTLDVNVFVWRSLTGDWTLIQRVFPSHSRCSWDSLQIHRAPEQD